MPTSVVSRTTGDRRAPGADHAGVPPVYRSLHSAILAGIFVPGQRLVEDDICCDFGATRHSTRQALYRLSHTGLVIIRPNRGAHVRRLSHGDVREVLELLGPVQAFAAGLAAARCRPEDVRELASLIEASVAAAPGAPPEALVEIARNFDLRVAAAGRNGAVIETVERLTGVLSLARPHPVASIGWRDLRSYQQGLCDSIQDRNGYEAQRRARRRIEGWNTAIRTTVR